PQPPADRKLDAGIGRHIESVSERPDDVHNVAVLARAEPLRPQTDRIDDDGHRSPIAVGPRDRERPAQQVRASRLDADVQELPGARARRHLRGFDRELTVRAEARGGYDRRKADHRVHRAWYS